MRALALLILAGCATITAVSRTDAIVIATEAATAEGIAVADYDLANVSEDGNRWDVFFTLKPPGRPGGHFMVVVVKNDGSARLIPGK
jgi:hypothetical protein